MSVEEVSMNDLSNRNASSLVKNPTEAIQSNDDLHHQFRTILFRFLQEFGQSPVTFSHKFAAGNYTITMSKKEVKIVLKKDSKNEYLYTFQNQVLKKNNKEVDDEKFPKFIDLTRKIIMDILKNDVKYI